MSRTIDERVVSMQFDNKQFENNVQTSLGTLEKLKQGLNFTGAVKGLETVDSAAKGINFSPLSSAVDAIGTKFSAMQVMAVTALANITNSAVNAGKRIASALTIEPVKSGFQEYETQINSVQTILANTQSKGSTLEDVNSALDELNTYADKTIYNFTEMTRNIGTFTAAGVGLALGIGFYEGAITAAIGIYLILTILQRLDNRVHKRIRVLELYVELENTVPLSAFLQSLRELELKLEHIQFEPEACLETGSRAVVVTLKSKKAEDHVLLRKKIQNIPGVVHLEEL